MNIKIKIILMLICVGILGIAVLGLSDTGASWKSYNLEYQQKTGKNKPNTKPKVKIIKVKELKIRDKCTSCHVAIKDIRMFGEKNPLKPHPLNYLTIHPPERFGCTICHEGNGNSLDVKEAHEGSFLKGLVVQTSCCKCHSEISLEGAPNLSKGKSLLIKLQCVNCHFIQNLTKHEYFSPAPKLHGLGSKINEKWLIRWLKDPTSVLSNSRMPVFQVEEKYINALAGYLMNSSNPEIIDQDTQYPEGDPDTGKGTLRLAFCITCHPFNGKGGKDAPDLGKIGNKVKEEWLLKMLTNPHIFQPGTPMPRYNFKPSEISNIAAYLMDEFTDYDMLDEDDNFKIPVFWETQEKRIEIGRKVYKELRCANCHGFLENDGEWVNIGPDLSLIGDKNIKEINFGNSKIPRTLPDYLFGKIKDPQAFATPTNLLKMPKYNLPDEDIRDIVIALLSFNSKKLDVKNYFVPVKENTRYEPRGDFGRLVNKFRCFSCHSFKNHGHNITYDLSVEGSRVQGKWLFNYLKFSYTIRPILTIRMPIFKMTDNEAEILTNGFLHEMTDPKIESLNEQQFTDKQREKGELLFHQKGCLACHQLNQRGGYVGPSFTQGSFIGDKLKPGWIFHWLKNPRLFKPDVLEPDYQLSNEDALNITAYIMSLSKASNND